MGDSNTAHPYRPEPPPAPRVASTPRHIPWIVRVHVLLGDASGLLGTFIPGSVIGWVWLRGSAILVLATAVVTALLAIQVVRRMRSLRLLRFGRVTYATLTSKEEIPRGVSDDGPTRYQLGFRFEDRGETYNITIRTTSPGPLVDDPREQLVFLPNDPLGAELVDSLPGRPRIREDNTISPGDHPPGATLAMILLAGALIAGTVDVWLWLR